MVKWIMMMIMMIPMMINIISTMTSFILGMRKIIMMLYIGDDNLQTKMTIMMQMITEIKILVMMMMMNVSIECYLR